MIPLKSAKYLRALMYSLNPIIVSLYPIIFLYAFNIEMLRLGQTYLPILFAVILALLTFTLSSLFMKSMLKGSIAAVCFLILFWNYDLFYQGMHYLFAFRQRHVLPLALLIFMLLIYLLKRTDRRERLKVVNTLITVVFSFLIVINLFTIVPAEIAKNRAAAVLIEHEVETSADFESIVFPDVYLLIFDEYARLDTMKEEWGYDNSHFAGDLEKRGLFLAEESMVRFTATIKTMPELLNIDHFDEKKNDAELINLYYNNLLFSYFHNRGFEIHFLDGYNHPLLNNLPEYVARITYSDLQGTMYNLFVDSFNALLFERSLLVPFEGWLPFNQPGLFYYTGNLGFFEYLNNIYPRAESPKFVFAHIWFPHLPYVFDREGNLTNNEVHFFQYQDYEAEKLKEMYLEQYIFATKVITEMVDSIISKSENEVIIVIQSDHGPRPTSAGNANIDDGLKVLNIIYFPDGDYSKLTDDLSPVNTMRVVLNRYFGEELEMLE